MKREIDINRYFGEVPAAFSARLERTVANLKEEKTVNRKYTYRTALIAAIITILTIGTALAATTGADILGFFRDTSQLEPALNAIDTIEHNLGTIITPDVALTVREAAYDGSAVRVLMAVEVKEKDKYLPVDEFDAEYTVYDRTTGETAREYAERTGRSVYNVGFVDIVCMNATMNGGTGEVRYEGDTMLVYRAWTLVGKTPEVLEVCVPLNLEGAVWDLTFNLNKTASLETAYEVRGENIGGIIVEKVLRRDTPFTTDLLIYYDVCGEQTRNALSEETVYATVGGTLYHAVPDCSGMTGAGETTAKMAEQNGKTPCPICIGAAMASEEYYATVGGSFYHAVPDCGGMNGAQPITAEKAEEDGKRPCPLCFEGMDEPAQMRWTLKGEEFEMEFTQAFLGGNALNSVEPGDEGVGSPFICFTTLSGGMPEGEMRLEIAVEGGDTTTMQLIPLP